MVTRPRLPEAFLLVACVIVPALALRMPLAGPAARGLAVAAVGLSLLPGVLAWAVPRWVPRASRSAAGAALVLVALGAQAAVSLHLPYIEQGLWKDRRPAHAPLEDPAGPGARAVRWR
jgi:hypothetical protein